MFHTLYIMKYIIIFFKKNIALFLMASFLMGSFGCEIDEIPNPNGPDLDAIVNNATRGDLNALVTGIESLMADDIDFYYDVTGIIGREFYFFTSADTRFTGELLGKGDQVLDNAGFYGTRPYQGRYRSIKNANVLIEAVNNNATNLSLSNEEVNGYVGFAQAVQAYELHLALMLQNQNGIRTNVVDPSNLGDFVSFDQALSDIKALIDASIANLGNAGTSFSFPLSPGYSGFDSPATFAQYVNALGARVAIYQNDKPAALTYLGKSFLDMNGDLNVGPQRFFSSAGGEQINELFRLPGQSEALIAHPTIVAALTANPADLRNSKIIDRGSPVSSDDLTGDHDVSVYKSINDNVPIIRNEELILLLAEANIGSDNPAALDAINAIRTTNGLSALTNTDIDVTNDDELIDELLNQRWFSLFFEGHRWVDMRRFNRLGELPIDRVDDDVWVEMPRPVSEIE